ncbi:hypothetical protein [Leptotrichia sp. oral taxon 847]|uniref:hypothetical protein n=1 Tax=Leptotrichia sp. oral taxon 847 TaxID=1785996 RepID=UPI0007681908|nr:hypothetical protein [Leptotrichia sp. oral taxon 847]AMD95786.1 hypothetical protein AXF11_09515 [Leptotrichia sp. oral taxon 847]
MKITELNEVELMTIDGGAKKKTCKRIGMEYLKELDNMQVLTIYLDQPMENILQLQQLDQRQKTITSQKP